MGSILFYVKTLVLNFLNINDAGDDLLINDSGDKLTI
jgi:hypothetical protein